jgi:N-acetylglucosaminyldiphosphoundecaprenol N-acetyl-beta-D-mannosaminyltransferase
MTMLAIARKTVRLLGTSIEVTTMEAACQQVLALSRSRRPSYVCFATAHMLVEALRDFRVREAYAGAEVVNPDGVPLAWCLRAEGFGSAECVSGPRLFPRVLELAAQTGRRVGFYGGREETLALIRSRLEKELPTLNVAYMRSPPFRPLSEAEQHADLREIAESGTEMLFVGLGSPRQEIWMNRWASHLPCVSLGVGAAFEFYSGEKVLPPLWIQKLGLTWLVRLCQEPRRLIRRNLASPVFVYLVLKDRIGRLTRRKRTDSEPLPISAPNIALVSHIDSESVREIEDRRDHGKEANDLEICI